MAAAVLTSTLGGSYLLLSTTEPPANDFDPPHQTPSTAQGDAHPNDSNLAFAIDPTGKPSDRQIQFTTRGGTRVIWLLKPSLNLEPQP